MSWPETLTLVVTIVVAVLGGIIYGNKRLDDLRAELTGRFGDLRVDVGARFTDVNTRFTELREDMNTRFAELRGDLNRGLGEVRADVRDLRTLVQEALRSRAS